TINKEEAFRSDELKQQLALIVEGIREQLPPSLTQVLQEQHLTEAAPDEQLRFLDSYLSGIASGIIKIPIAISAGFYWRDKDRFLGLASSAIPLQWPSGIAGSAPPDDVPDPEERTLVHEQIARALRLGQPQFVTQDLKDHIDW